jgi:hypothetical protein
MHMAILVSVELISSLRVRAQSGQPSHPLISLLWRLPFRHSRREPSMLDWSVWAKLV